MYVLGIESSCDENAASIVSSDKKILSNIVFSQNMHNQYGGVVPEVGSRAHLDMIKHVVELSLKEANMKVADLTAIAATFGPGLIGGLIVGFNFAKTLCAVHNKTLIAINHVEAHALTARLIYDIPFPYLLLLASGGHTQWVLCKGVDDYIVLGKTLDDAMGECFDKVAKMLNLGYPGGAVIEKLALEGDHKRFALPQPLKGREGCDFSFSGLKTAAFNLISSLDLDDQTIKDIAASLQYTIIEVVKNRAKNAITMAQDLVKSKIKHIVLAGGVAANQKLRNELGDIAQKNDIDLLAPPINLCTDNGAMIAWNGIEKLNAGIAPDSLYTTPLPRVLMARKEK